MTYAIQTDRLLLRPVAGSDVPLIVEGLSDFRVCRHLARVPYPYHRADAEDFIAWSAALPPDSAVRVIALRHDPAALIGMISYEYSAAEKDAELGYWLSLPAWGRGYGTEAASAMVEDAFVRAGHSLLRAAYFNDNPVSGRLLRRIGFVEIGPGTSFSRARACEVQKTRLMLTRERWQSLFPERVVSHQFKNP